MQYPEYAVPEGEGPKASRAALDLNNYGAKCRGEQKFVSAEIAFRRCTTLHPEVPVFWSNLGATLLDQNKYEEVFETFLRGIELAPLDAKMVGNLALATAKRGDYDKGMALFQEALNLSPTDTSILWNRSCTMLSQGHWEALPDYERYRNKSLGEDYFKNAKFPYWDGIQDLNGKKLFIQFDQGLGDRILCSRFVYHLKQKYPTCEIIVSAHDRMSTLFWGFQQDNTMLLLPEKVPFPKADYGVYATDLLRISEVKPDTIPKDPGVILKYVDWMAKAMEPEFPMPLVPSVKVGVCWTGNFSMPRNNERTVPPELMLSLAEIPNVSLYSLQAGVGAQDVERLGAHGLLHCGPGFGAELEQKGLAFTAAVMLNLDVVITCCTAVAHLAGTLNVPTWLLLCHDPYWIWLRHGDSTKWYPSVTIFRQPEPRDWSSVITDVKQRLKATADELLGEIAS